jgi:hypothetical protein
MPRGNVRYWAKADIRPSRANVRLWWKADVRWGIHLPMTAAPNGEPVFRIAIGRRVHISGWPAVLLAPLAIPAILLITLSQRLFGLKSTADLSAQEVESYLRDFLEGTGSDWDWDDFTSVSITDPTLERFRGEAASVPLPLDAEGEATLRRLLEEVRAL